MNTEETIIIIEKLTETLGITANEIINYYSIRHFWQAIGYICFGLAFMAVGYFILKYILSLDASDEAKAVTILILTICLFAGGLMVAYNIDNLVSPKAAAIQQIIRDVRGDKEK